MDSLRQGFGLGFGLFAALVTLVLLLAFCFCCVLPAGLVGLGALSDSTPVARRPTRTPLPSFSGGSQPAPANPAPAGSVAGSIGQDVMVGQVRWKFLEAADKGNTLADDYEFTQDLTTTGRFIQVRFELENRSPETLNFTDINLVDDQGRTFRSSSDATVRLAAAQQETCLFQQLNPNITKTCTQIFEVPSDAHNLKAQVGDLKLLGNAEALIDLGLP